MYFIKCISCLINVFHYNLPNSATCVRVLTQNNPAHGHQLYFLKRYFHIILLSTPRASNCSISTRFPPPNPSIFSLLPHTCHMPHPSHFRWFYHPNIWRGVQNMKSHYTVFYSLLLLPTSQAQISSSALNYRTCSVYIVRSVWEITFKKQFSVNRI